MGPMWSSDEFDGPTLEPVGPVENENDEAQTLQLITQMRLYDVLMGIYTHLAPDKARAVAEIHSQGGLVGASPAFMGLFLTDKVNADESDVPKDDVPPE